MKGDWETGCGKEHVTKDMKTLLQPVSYNHPLGLFLLLSLHL